MSETDRQKKNPRPQGMGRAVPVLFTLRNVQPSIVVRSSVPTTSTNAEMTNAEMIAATSRTSPSTSATPPSPTPKSAPPAPKNNRSYNVVVGLLVIAVCLLVVKNSQKNTETQKNSIAAQQEAVTPADSKLVVESKPSTTTPGPFKSNDFAALNLNPPPVSIPALPAANSKLTQSGPTTIDKTSMEFPTDSISLEESNAYQSRSEAAAAAATSLALQQAPLPMLLTSAQPETAASPAQPSTVAESADNSDRTGQSSPQTRTAMKSDAPPVTVPQSFVQQRAATQAADTQILDTREPYMSTRSLIDKYMVGKSTTELNKLGVTPYQPEQSRQSIPASPVSNVGQRVENPQATNPTFNSNNYLKENGMLSGSPYPPVSKEYQPISTRAYEQGGLSNVGVPNANQNSKTIKEPAISSNRYSNSTQPPVAPIPYIPMAPQSGMPTIPPGNGN